VEFRLKRAMLAGEVLAPVDGLVAFLLFAILVGIVALHLLMLRRLRW